LSALKWLGTVPVLCVCGISAQAAAAPAAIEPARAGFEDATRRLAAELTIPGIAYAVIHDGKVARTGAIQTSEGPGITPLTPLRFASVTKAFTAVLLMRAVENGRISLDDRVGRWLPEFRDRPEITVHQLAAHVSEGIPGTEYVYGTQRYARLGEILRQAHGAASFEAALRREVIEPAGLAWHDSPDLGAHAALVSSVAEVAKFALALQTHELIGEKSFDRMTTPFRSPGGAVMPVGVGFFSQQVGGERVVWSFGQDDPDHSSALLLMVPARKLALVMLANTDELSNPFRLMMGNLRNSPFATAFLDHYAPDLARDITPRDRDISNMLAALASDRAPSAIDAFSRLAARDASVTGDDFALHFLAGVLAERLPRDFCEKLDDAVLAAHPRNRWALLMSGGINSQLGKSTRALTRYETLLALPNQEPDGLWRLFQAWAYTGSAAAVKSSDPARARGYVDAGLATGVTGGTRDSLLQMREALSK
jgi:CubicO group peptidase (beta-lactamase class C family)